MKEIPIIDIGTQGFDALVTDFSHYTDIILDEAVKSYTKYGLKFGDVFSKHWANKSEVLYKNELRNIEKKIGTGAWMLNFSYEFGCTTAVVPDGPKLLRVLDWALPGLGKTLVAVKKESDAGSWINLTWPGFVGSVQGMAPGRFAAAINHAPPSDTGLGFYGDWVAGKLNIFSRTSMPPTHLLRLVFEQCETFEEALNMLLHTPICAPVFYTLVGCHPGDIAVIERLPNSYVCHDGLSCAISNHWISEGMPGRSHSVDTVERLETMQNHLDGRGWHPPAFCWLDPPILNECTRLVFEAHPSIGEIIACAYEDGYQVSKRTKINM